MRKGAERDPRTRNGHAIIPFRIVERMPAKLLARL